MQNSADNFPFPNYLTHQCVVEESTILPVEIYIYIRCILSKLWEKIERKENSSTAKNWLRCEPTSLCMLCISDTVVASVFHQYRYNRIEMNIKWSLCLSFIALCTLRNYTVDRQVNSLKAGASMTVSRPWKLRSFSCLIQIYSVLYYDFIVWLQLIRFAECVCPHSVELLQCACKGYFHKGVSVLITVNWLQVLPLAI